MATITVRNSLPDVDPYRVTLTALRTGETLIWPYNPESWTTEHNARWRARGASGAQRDLSDWEGNDPIRVRFRQLLGPRPDGDPLDVERVVHQLEVWTGILDEVTGEPPLLFLSIGRSGWPVVIESLPVNRLRTAPTGEATQAEIDVTFRVNPK